MIIIAFMMKLGKINIKIGERLTKFKWKIKMKKIMKKMY